MGADVSLPILGMGTLEAFIRYFALNYCKIHCIKVYLAGHKHILSGLENSTLFFQLHNGAKQKQKHEGILDKSHSIF